MIDNAAPFPMYQPPIPGEKPGSGVPYDPSKHILFYTKDGWAWLEVDDPSSYGLNGVRRTV